MPSDQAAKQEELKYYERLNISVLSIAKIKDLIKSDIKETINAWNQGRNVKKQCWHIVGPAGVGKTEICYQIAEELTEEFKKPFEIIMVKAPVLSRDDFIIPFPVTDNGNTSFKMLYSDFVPKGDDSFGIFVIDEFSRGDHTLQQLLWQVQNEYAIHRYDFPKGWFVISIDNPDDSAYTMDTMEDAAGLRRQLHIYTEVSPIDFLNYAIKNKFHPLVVEFIQTHPEYLYDFQAQVVGSVYANPASYEKLSDHLWKMEMNGGIDFDVIESKASGLLNTNMTRMFIEFAQEKKDINPKDIFERFPQVKPAILQLKKENNNAKLGELMVGFCTFMTTSMPPVKKENLKYIEEFLLMMPIDTAAIFITQIDKFERTSPAFKYMTKIHLTLLKQSKKYEEEFYNPIVDCGEGKLN
jgi:DNA polymerase III delta prime subunit